MTPSRSKIQKPSSAYKNSHIAPMPIEENRKQKRSRLRDINSLFPDPKSATGNSSRFANQKE